MLNKRIGILGTGSSVPDKVLTNADLEKIVDTSDEWITTRTGIKERRIATENESASTFAHEASIKALRNSSINAEEIDLIICATVTPDMAFPATACILQDMLGLKHIPAFDLSAGCSGFGYAISVAEGLLQSGQYKKALVVGVDLLSKITDYTDRSTCVLFGDGAGAVILGEVEDGYGILASELGAEGSGAEFLQIPAGGSVKPATKDTVKNKEHFIKMAGSDVFKFAVRIMADCTQRLMDKVGLSPDEVHWVVPHQANVRIITAAASRLGIPEERFFINVDLYGNTSAASIGLALDELALSGKLKEGDHVVMVGFGAGLTWSGLLIKWGGGKNNVGE